MGRIRTFSGKHVNPLNLKPEDIDIRDIAQGLSNICRYNGQCKRFYSVAEHCFHVASLVPAKLRLAALLHDASEAYLSDLSTFVKHSRPLAGYRRIEEHVEGVIERTFGLKLSDDDRDLIKAADVVMYKAEKAALFDGEITAEDAHPKEEWAFLKAYKLPSFDVIRCYRPEDAKQAFLSVYLMEILPANQSAEFFSTRKVA